MLSNKNKSEFFYVVSSEEKRNNTGYIVKRSWERFKYHF